MYAALITRRFPAPRPCGTRLRLFKMAPGHFVGQFCLALHPLIEILNRLLKTEYPEEACFASSGFCQIRTGARQTFLSPPPTESESGIFCCIIRSIPRRTRLRIAGSLGNCKSADRLSSHSNSIQRLRNRPFGKN